MDEAVTTTADTGATSSPETQATPTAGDERMGSALYDTVTDGGDEVDTDAGDTGQSDEIDILPEDREAGDKELILGRFKSPEDLAKSYTELEGVLKTKGYGAPEKYDWDDAFAESGLIPRDRTEHAAEYDAFDKFLRESGCNQKQAKAMLKFGGAWMEQQMAALGPSVDMKKEKATLAEEWGNEADSRGKAVMSWAATNLPPEVLTRPLQNTAEGMKFLHDLMKTKKGGVPMSNTRPAGLGKDDLVLELGKLMDNPEYFSGTDQGDALQRKARELSSRISRFK